MNENRFYICEHCGNIVGMIHDAGKSLRCCGEKMKQLKPSADASAEKHTPIVKVEGNTELLPQVVVTVQSHPKDTKVPAGTTITLTFTDVGVQD